MKDNVQQEKGNKWVTRISYAIGAFGNDWFYAVLSTYFIMFVTSHLFGKGDNAMILYITNIIALLRIVELFIDPIIGNAIDRTKTRWGKFKPWIFGGGMVSSIALAVLFTNMGGLNRTHPFIYLAIFAVLYISMDIFYSFKDTSFWSEMSSLTFDSGEREKISTFARIGSNIGANLVGMVIMPLVLFFSLTKNGGSGDLRGWSMFGMITAAIVIITVLVVCFGTHELDSDLRKNKEETKLKDVFKVLLGNDQLMWTAVSYGLYCIGINIFNSAELYYFTYVLGESSKFAIIGTINMILGFFSISAFPALAKKFNRKNVFYACILIMFCGAGLLAIAGKNLALVVLAMEMFAAPQAVIFLVILMTITDSIEYGQLKLGHRDESLTLSVRPLLDKLGGAIAGWCIGPIAILSHMTSGYTYKTITPGNVMTFKLFVIALPVILILLGTFFFWKKVTLTEKRHAEIVEQLEKSWGEENDTSVGTGEHAVAGEYDIVAPIKGTYLPLKDVSDQTFASGQMGQGFALKPSDGAVYAPFDGVVRQVFPTRHAIGIESEHGVIMLIHIGIGTVNMHGTGFVSYVEQGQQIHKGEEIMEFWDPAIKKAGYDDTVMVTITNTKEFDQVDVLPKDNQTIDSSTNVVKLIKN